jgi:hypothetical protein
MFRPMSFMLRTLPQRTDEIDPSISRIESRARPQPSSVLGGSWLARGRLLRLQNLLDDLRFVLAAIFALYEDAILFDCKLYWPVHSKNCGLRPSPLDVLLAHINVVSGGDGVGLIDLIHGCRRTVCVPVCRVA